MVEAGDGFGGVYLVHVTLDGTVGSATAVVEDSGGDPIGSTVVARYPRFELRRDGVLVGGGAVSSFGVGIAIVEQLGGGPYAYVLKIASEDAPVGGVLLDAAQITSAKLSIQQFKR